MSLTAAQWSQVETLFADAVDLPQTERRQQLDWATFDPAVRAELEALLAAADSGGDFLSRSATVVSTGSALDSLAAGARLGPWRVLRLIGRGGMGEVYEAQRADGQFEQRAALKLLWQESAQLLKRFQIERQILARLDHPGIAHLLDGGVTSSGQPYAVMEYIVGETITNWSRARASSLQDRLRLFLQVCEAVTHAHRNLIVHRDLKPANILVDASGRVRLLDFGIAKLLDSPVPLGPAGVLTPSGVARLVGACSGSSSGGRATAPTMNLFTPDYAAPEQLAGEAITTGTDVYALGLLLFELLTNQRARAQAGYPLAVGLRATFDAPAPVPSRAADLPGAPVPAKRLTGDLDAIVAKCLCREPAQRYQSVDALRLDLERSLRGDTVNARGDGRLYILGSLVRRHRRLVAGVVALTLSLALGVAGVAWQAAKARREMARAIVTKDFLISVFRASDPRIASERPRGQITAKELLDLSAERIALDFAADPATQLELLGVVSDIYAEFDDEKRFKGLLAQRKELARKYFGETHPVVVESVLSDAWGAIVLGQDYAKANRFLDEADRLIRAGGHEQSVQRAEWWFAKEQALKAEAGSVEARKDALRRSVELYDRLDPKNINRAQALGFLAYLYAQEEDFARARQVYEAAIAAFELAGSHTSPALGRTYANLARTLAELGDADGADRVYLQALELIRKTLGEGHFTYWLRAADHARFVHLRGDRERAHRLFESALGKIPAGSRDNAYALVARELYASCLAAEGREEEAIPLLEKAEQSHRERPIREFDLRRVRLTLGDAYDRAGRVEDARRVLKASFDETIARDPVESSAALAARERWGRFLLSQGELAGAAEQFREVFAHARGRNLAPVALAHGDQARLLLARGDAAAALVASAEAVKTLEGIVGLHDVRIEPYLWRIHADALAAAGQIADAGKFADRALAASRRYDDPSSPTTKDAVTAK